MLVYGISEAINHMNSTFIRQPQEPSGATRDWLRWSSICDPGKIEEEEPKSGGKDGKGRGENEEDDSEADDNE
jgi:hypothetical protein